MTKPTFIDPFDNAESTKPAFVDPFETDAPTSKPEPKSGTIRRAIGDTALTALKSTIAVPEIAVGLADLVSGGRAGKLAEEAGFKPKQAKEFISDYYSPEQKLANQKVQEADGFIDTAKTALQYPSTIFHTTLESLGGMGVGGLGARGLMAVAPKVAPFVAGAIGEGLVTAGQNAEQLRQETDDGLLTGKQAAITAGSGALTGLISGASGSIAKKLGIADIDTLIAEGKLAGKATGLPKAIAGGVVSEGILEEAPQSAQEQIAQNLSLDKPWDEGVGNAAAMGALSGGLMGGGANALNAFGGKDNTQVTPPPAPPAPEGSLTSAATIAQAVGLTPQPVTPDVTTEAKPNIVDSLNAVEAQQNGVISDTTIAPEQPLAEMPAPTLAPEQAAEKQRIDEIAHQAATSPLNDLPQPTEKQVEAGNYKKGHIKYDGLNITVENPQGSTRSGVDEDGKTWENTLANHYGYIKRTKGNDGDNLDVFVGDKPANGKVFVINQTKKDGSFDEHKAVLGAETADEAIAIYKSNYADDWNGGKSVTELTTPAFKDWLKNGDPTKPLETVSATNNDVDMTKVAVGEQIDVGGVPYVKTENGFERVTSATENVVNATSVDTTTTLPERVDETANGVQVPTIRKGEVGGMLAAKEIVATASGRSTTPFPNFNGKDGKVSNFGLKAVDKWLVDNAIAEAESRNDDFNLTQFKAINLKNLSQADKDGAEEYLFGSQPAVVPSILKPLVTETAITPENGITQESAPANESVQQTQTPKANTKPKSNSLLAKLKALGGVTIKDKRDVTGEDKKFAPGGYNRIFMIKSQKSLKGLIESGDLDEYLPYNMRLEANGANDDAFDSTEAYDYLADKIRNGEHVLPYAVVEEAQANQFYQEEEATAESDVQEAATLLTEEEINEEFRIAGNEEREATAAATEFKPDSEEGDTASGTGRKTEPQGTGSETSQVAEVTDNFTLSGQTNEDINAGIAAQEAEARAQQEQAKSDEAARIEAERKSRQEIAADSFDLTQTGKDAKSTKANDAKVIDNQFAGQGDLLSQPAEQPKAETKAANNIQDLGEKIGGARKDTAVSTGAKAKRTDKNPDVPTWAKRYNITETVYSSDEKENGTWSIYDSREKDRFGQTKVIGKGFASKEAAMAELPALVVGAKHRVVATAQRPDGTYGFEIYRSINERKRVKIVDKEFDSRVEALTYMGEHAAEILETNTTFGEVDLPTPDDTNRIGVARRSGDVKDTDFMDTFGFRGVEFGEWNNQIERQQVMNAAYDGLLDLAEVLNLPPKALTLNGDLALAFGARGQGLSAAKAHYERDKSVINLTKMNGAGSLAHEFFHALDHYLGRQDGKASSEWVTDSDGTRSFKAKEVEDDMVSSGFSYKSNVREEVRTAYKALMETMFRKATTYVEDTQEADKFVARAKDDLASRLDSIRNELSVQKDPKYYKRNNKPATAEQLAEFDTIAKQLLDGQGLDAEYRAIDDGRKRTRKWQLPAGRHTNDALEKISAIYKAVRGRNGFDSTNQNGTMDYLRGTMSRYSGRLKMLADAQQGNEKVRQVPTNFALNAKELDQGRGKDYWTTPHEMAARAFQGYVEDKIAATGGKSPFLNYGREGAGILTPWGVKFPFPRGEERKAINTALDKFVSALQTKETDKGIALYQNKEEYGNYGITEKQRSELTEPERRAYDQSAATAIALRGVKNSVLGLAVSKDFKQTGSTSLLGKQIATPEDLAVAAQVYRDPRFETVRYFFIKDGSVISQTSVTSKLSGIATLSPNVNGEGVTEFISQIATEAANLGADGVYLLHNHPDGNPTPSKVDITATKFIQGVLAEKNIDLLGHVIINHQKYAVIDRENNQKVIERKFENTYSNDNPAVPHAILGKVISDQYDLAEHAKAIEFTEGNVVLIGTSGTSGISVITEIEPADLKPLKLAAILRKLSRQSGAESLFAYNVPLNLSNLAAKAIKNSILVDAITTDTYGNKQSLRSFIDPDDNVTMGRPLKGYVVKQAGVNDNYPVNAETSYSRPKSKFTEQAKQSQSIDIRDLNAVVANVNQALRGLPATHVLEDYTKAPAELVADIKRDKAYDAAGAWHNGEIYLFRNNIINTNHALFTMLHESTHEGLRRVFGKEIDATLMGIYLSNKDIKQQSDNLRATHKDLSLVASVEEALADMGGNGIKASVMDKLIAFVRNALRRLGMNLKVSDSEVRAIVTRALDRVKSPSKVTHYTIGSAYSAASSGDQTNTPEFQAWFGKSKVVDKKGNPLVVYHGTGTKGITVFDTNKAGTNLYSDWGAGIYITPRQSTADYYRQEALANQDKEAAQIFNKMQELEKDITWRNGTPTYPEEYDELLNKFREVREKARASGGGEIMPLYVRLENPHIVSYQSTSNPGEGVTARANGNDGIIVLDYDGNIDEIIVFDPAQIKSAVGNNGDFDPNNPDIRYSRPTPRLSPVVQPTTPNQQWQSPDKSKLDNVIYMLQNKFVDLKRVTQAIQKSGNTIEDKWNPYLLEENFTGRTAKRTKDFLKQELEPLMKSMQARKVEMADFEEYLWARHAEERNIQIAKINPAMQDGGSGMTTQDARDYLANLTPEQSANYQALAAKVDAILKTSRQRLISYGLETPETIAAWEGAYQHYVPLMREDMDNGFGNGSGQGFSVKGNASKRATGSQRAVVDVLANIAQQVERNIIRGEKNRVSTALVGLATLNPNKDFWKVDVVPKIRTVVAGKNSYEVLYNGSVVQTFTNPVEANKFIQWNGAGYTLNVVKGQDLVMDVPDPSYKSRDNIVVARIVNAKGKIEEHFVEFNTHDERAMRAAASIKNLDQDQIGELLGTASSITRYFSSINTQYNPFFGVINILRDVQGSLLNLSSTELAGKQMDVLKNTPLALMGIYNDIRSERKTGTPTNSFWALLFEDFQKQGGQTGYRDMYRNAKERGEALKHALDPTWWQQTTAGKIVTINGILAKPEQFLKEKGQQYIFDWLSDYNESMENAVRLSAYKVALDNGMSKAQAASLAKNISVNFNRKGEMGRQIGSLYAFFNASVQGTARIGETLFTDDNGKLTLSKAGKAIVTGGLLLGVMQALMLAAAGFGDDEPPEFVRDRNLIIPLGNGKAITIAMPLGFNALPAFGRILTEWALSGGEDTSKRFFHIFEMLAEVTNPIGNAGLSMQTITPTMFDPLAALAENKDWTGRPIAKMDFNSQKPTAGHTRAKDTASAISKGLSWVINEATGGSDYTPGALSPTPDQIDYLIGQLTGGVGREYMKLEQSATSIVTGEDLPVYKIPLVGRFYLDAEGQSSQSSRFYDNLKSVFETETELKGLRKDGLDTSEYRANHPEAALVFRANLEQREISQLYKIRSEKLKADASPDEIKALNERITARMLKFNELFKTRTTAGE